MSGGGSKSKHLLASVVAVWLSCAWQVTAHAQETSRSNWTSSDASCAKYNDLRKRVLGNIGVKIDATEAWADGFRRALGFWNKVLAVNFHEEANLDSCSVRIIDAPPEIMSKAMVARSQLAERDNFRGEIAVSPAAAKVMSSAEIYGAAVHELGHMLGLKHNASSQSVMYFLNVKGTEVLDSHDILDLSAHHELRMAPVPLGSIDLSCLRGCADTDELR